jgi:hypothetical protein
MFSLNHKGLTMYKKMLISGFMLLASIALTNADVQAAKDSKQWDIPNREQYSPEELKEIEEACKALDKIKVRVNHDDEQLTVTFSGFGDGKRTHEREIVWNSSKMKTIMSGLENNKRTHALLLGQPKDNKIDRKSVV